MAEALYLARGGPGSRQHYKVFASGIDDTDIHREWLADQFKKYSSKPPEIIDTYECDNSLAALRLYHQKLDDYYRIELRYDAYIDIPNYWAGCTLPIVRRLIQESIAETNLQQ